MKLSKVFEKLFICLVSQHIYIFLNHICIQADVEVTFSFSCLDKVEKFNPIWVSAKDLYA